MLQFARLFLLTRLLPVSDFGTMGLINALLALGAVFSGFGINNYLIHKQDLKQKELSTIYLACLALGVLTTLLVAISAIPLHFAYQDDQLLQLVPLAALVFTLTAFGAPFQSLMIKSLSLKRLALIEITASVASIAIGVAAALASMGAASLVLAVLAAALTKSVLLILASTHPWRPSLQFDASFLGPAMNYGGYQAGGQLANQLRANLDVFFIGFFWGPSILGFYALAKQMARYPQTVFGPVISRIALPLFARQQSDMPALQILFRKAVALNAFIYIPCYALLITFASQINQIAYAIDEPIMVNFLQLVACLWMLRQLMGPIGGALLQAVGRVELEFRWNMALLPVIGLLTVSLTPFGTIALLGGLLLAQLVFIFSYRHFCLRHVIAFSNSELLSSIAPPLAASTVSSALLYAISSVLPSNPYLALPAGLVLFAISYLTIYRILFGGHLAQCIGLLRATGPGEPVA